MIRSFNQHPSSALLQQLMLEAAYQIGAKAVEIVEPFVLVDVYFNNVTETKCRTEAEAVELVETANRFPGWRYSRVMWRGQTRRIFQAGVLG